MNSKEYYHKIVILERTQVTGQVMLGNDIHVDIFLSVVENEQWLKEHQESITTYGGQRHKICFVPRAWWVRDALGREQKSNLRQPCCEVFYVISSNILYNTVQ